ncbi:biotin transporter BioY [Lichenifustis flavocetrariae]|uniref:Biotin transporter n=1 Tax=Lichenifustis flavocetrariae TaxID=2949735 RepID=A0AA42CMF8_9HYPH|nr:biotin transporter BioY [Lichenifustis flavocetrariae]MCW6508300.1 biotin transporter BioY [Lichenifustis flavocetrariae]
MSLSKTLQPSNVRPSSHVLRTLACVVGGSGLLALAAHVAVPFWPVPITLQTLAVLGLGAMLGPAVAVGTLMAYLLEGLCGLPVFAHGSGFAVLAGPTGGYLLGYVPAAFAAGLAARRGWLAKPLSAFTAFLLADAVIFVLGVGWLAALFGWEKAVAVGFTPFLIGEALKLALLTAATQMKRA